MEDGGVLEKLWMSWCLHLSQHILAQVQVPAPATHMIHCQEGAGKWWNMVVAW